MFAMSCKQSFAIGAETIASVTPYLSCLSAAAKETSRFPRQIKAGPHNTPPSHKRSLAWEGRTSAARFGEGVHKAIPHRSNQRKALHEKLANRSFSDPPGFARRVKCMLPTRDFTLPQTKFGRGGSNQRSEVWGGESTRQFRIDRISIRPSPKNWLNARFPTLPASPGG